MCAPDRDPPSVGPGEAAGACGGARAPTCVGARTQVRSDTKERLSIRNNTNHSVKEGERRGVSPLGKKSGQWWTEWG